MKYDFDQRIDRSGTNAFSCHGWRGYLVGGRQDPICCPEEECVSMWVADMSIATPPQVLDAIHARLDRGILGYTEIYDPAYYQTLKNWFAKRYNWNINTEEVVTSPGIVEALNRLVGMLCKPGEGVMMLTPSYGPFNKAALKNGCRSVRCDLKGDQGYYTVDFADFETKVKDPALKVFILCNPHNPTGRVWSREELQRMGQLCLENDVIIISDEIHCDLLRIGQQHISLATLFPGEKRIITCTAPSKTFNLAGLMLSHIFIPDEKLRETWKESYESLVSPLSIAGVQAAYGQCEDWLDQLRAYLDQNFEVMRAYLAENLPKAVFRIPEATYLAWVDVSAYIEKDEDACWKLVHQGGLLVDGGNQFVQNYDGYVRLNLACPRAMMLEGLQRMCKVLKG